MDRMQRHEWLFKLQEGQERTEEKMIDKLGVRPCIRQNDTALACMCSQVRKLRAKAIGQVVKGHLSNRYLLSYITHDWKCEPTSVCVLKLTANTSILPEDPNSVNTD